MVETSVWDKDYTMYTLVQGLSHSASPSILPTLQLEPLPRYCEYLPCFSLSLTCSAEARCRTQSAATCSRWFLARGFFYPEDGGDTFLRNVGSHKIYTAPHPRRRNSSFGKNVPRPQFSTSFTHLKSPENFL
jgi:hypothetical protein